MLVNGSSCTITNNVSFKAQVKPDPATLPDDIEVILSRTSSETKKRLVECLNYLSTAKNKKEVKDFGTDEDTFYYTLRSNSFSPDITYITVRHKNPSEKIDYEFIDQHFGITKNEVDSFKRKFEEKLEVISAYKGVNKH